jgi:hypothetical protein
MITPDELKVRAAFAKGQIVEALGDLEAGEVQRAIRALRYAIAELNGTARASNPSE